MKTLLIGLLAISSLPAFADENCQITLGFNDYFLQAEDGALAQADGNKFQLAYWKDHQLQTVSDAKITVEKAILFHQQDVPGGNRMGSKWLNRILDYAVRVKIETSTTEIYPRTMGSAIKNVNVSTMCTSITRVKPE